MAINTTDSLLEALGSSNLLDAGQLQAAREAAPQTDDPRALARLLVEKGFLTRWQAGQLLIGRTSFFLGRYKLIDLLGRGGMGSVFLAQHTMMNRTVAVKMISRELSQEPASRERFFAEARAAASLDHPNIVHAYTMDSEDDRYYMVLEYVEGQDLQRMVESQGPLDFQQAVDFIRQAADGLAHAHSKGMVHRDIKPSNLLVNPQGVVKILDLGMARLIDKGLGARDWGLGTREQESDPEARASSLQPLAPSPQPLVPSDERILGTVDYMAPEQGVQGPELDHRADIYSLGCTLYFLLTGSPPFPEGTLPERILKHQTEDPPSVLVKRPDAPRDLVRICEKMMAKDPADRFQTAAEVSAILGAWRPPTRRLIKVVPLEEEKTTEGGQTAGELERAAADGGGGTGDEGPKAGYGGLAGGEDLFDLMPSDQTALGHSPSGLGPPPSSPSSIRRRPSSKRRRSRDWRIPVLAGGGLLIVLVAGLVLWLRGARRDVGDVGVTPPAPATPSAAPGPSPPTSNPPAAGPTSSGVTPAKPKAQSKPQPSKPKPAKPLNREPAKKPKPDSPTTRPPSPAPEPPSPAPQSPSRAPGDAFADFPTAVDLRRLPDASEKETEASGVPLASVHTPAQVPWALKLIGGDRPLRNRLFTIQEEGGGASWPVHLGAASSGNEATPVAVARFFRKGESLMFQWIKGADAAQAEQFRNLALEIRVGSASRTLALRKPQQVDPITVDLLRPVLAGYLAVNWLPDPSCLRLEILGLEGRQGQTVTPSGPVGLKTFVIISLSKNDKRGPVPAEGVEFRLQLLQKGARLVVELRQSKEQVALFQPSRQSDSRSKIEAEIQNVKESLGKVRQQPNLSADQRKALAAPWEERLVAGQAALWYDGFFQAVHRKGRIHFRVLADLGGYQLELARTTP